jgi:ABC-type lipoprotein release transport system permease subunit
LSPDVRPAFEYFASPLWFFLEALGFSILVSLAAGVFPAARVDPVEALRHD